MKTLASGMDLYKLTMANFYYNFVPSMEGTFTFRSRGNEDILKYVPADDIRTFLTSTVATPHNLTHLQALCKYLDSKGIHILSPHCLAPYTGALEVTDAGGTLNITAGPRSYHVASLWETVVLAAVNEFYFESFCATEGIKIEDLHAEGYRRLNEKLAILRQYPDIKIADFGTRRRFSEAWQEIVLKEFVRQCPGNLIGTSNVEFAARMGLAPIGTMAHEMLMMYAGKAMIDGTDLVESQINFFRAWFGVYGYKLAIALTDTFGSDAFFKFFPRDLAVTYTGVRQDSGDPFRFGEKLLAYYSDMGIDAKRKTVVFSDSLDIHKIVALYERFHKDINVVFGWGTNLTNDVGLKPLNIVMKLTHLASVHGETDTVKLSDEIGKYTGPVDMINKYKSIFQG